MAERARHAFGSSSKIESALQQGIIDERDILFLDEDTDSPKIGWVKKDGTAVILKDEKADLTELEAEVAKKADAEEVEAKIEEASQSTMATANAYTDGKVEAAINEHMVKKYEFTDVPVGTLVDYREGEIRIMCPENAVFTKQSVGTGGDPSAYYGTLKTYAPNDAVVGYMEHLGNQSDSEILTDLKTDEYGRKYQPTWLALAKYDETTGWTYYGKNSSVDKYIGWDYQIDWYNAEGVMIASDSVRINLANEGCYSVVEPYYVNDAIKVAKEYTDTQIKEAVNGAIEVIEF